MMNLKESDLILLCEQIKDLLLHSSPTTNVFECLLKLLKPFFGIERIVCGYVNLDGFILKSGRRISLKNFEHGSSNHFKNVEKMSLLEARGTIVGEPLFSVEEYFKSILPISSLVGLGTLNSYFKGHSFIPSQNPLTNTSNIYKKFYRPLGFGNAIMFTFPIDELAQKWVWLSFGYPPHRELSKETVRSLENLWYRHGLKNIFRRIIEQIFILL